ncbi:MAG: phosphoglycerate kinase [Gammaproteobacteria bacterium]|nr:phosphoglycerate kinase [Gammaproteobacteria bacterium]
MRMLEMNDLDLAGKRVLIREDLNVPMQDGKITSDARIVAALPTIRDALKQKAKILLMSHLGRPAEGKIDTKFSLAPVAQRLSELLNQPVRLITDWGEANKLQDGDIALLENVRFNVGEEKNDNDLSKRLAALCDIFVMDAFATAHRAQASTVGVAKFAPIACAGPLLKEELTALKKAIAQPKHPLLAIVGGAKVSSKLTVLNALVEKVDQLILGGGIANTFLAAAGFPIGQSLHEPELIAEAAALMKKTNIPLPTDVIVAKEFSSTAEPTLKKIAEVSSDDMILDIGPETAAAYSVLINKAATIVWNGPVGVFEWPAFANGTQQIATAIAQSQAFSLAGGGDTISAIEHFGLVNQISYISTGGGAFLEFLEGKTLPGVLALEERC